MACDILGLEQTDGSVQPQKDSAAKKQSQVPNLVPSSARSPLTPSLVFETKIRMEIQNSRDQHESKVVSFLQNNVAKRNWEIELPPYGTGQETYFVKYNGHSCFVKLGAKTERYKVMSNLGLSPKVIADGYLDDGTSILVQQQINGKKPSRKDFHQYLQKFAQSIRITHNSENLKEILPTRSSRQYRDVGVEILEGIKRRWEKHKSKVPRFADYVDQKIEYLKNQVSQFQDGGLVASHNDICNGNWLVSSDDEKLYLLDYESMSLDDPALDLGAILWWYYPLEMRKEFLEVAGYRSDEVFRNRMRIRMAIHNLNIIIPRDNSFDRFSAEEFDEALVDFRAVIEGKQNPQGYFD